MFLLLLFIFFFKQKTAYEMRISDWSSDVCSSDLIQALRAKVTSKHRTVEDSLAEHQNIVKLLKAREKAKALSLLGVHIRAASRDYQIMLQEQARGREKRGG